MRKTPLRPGSPPVRKTPLRRSAAGLNPDLKVTKSGVLYVTAADVLASESGQELVRATATTRKAQAARTSRAGKTLREQVQRMERFGTYAWLIRVLPCCGCYPALYKGTTQLNKTVREFSRYVLGKRRLSEAAHLKSVGAGGLADGNLLPLCIDCHRRGDYALHFVGPSAFAERIGIPLEATARAIAATPQGKALLSIDKRAVKALRDLTVTEIAPNAWRVTGGETPGGQVVNRNPGFKHCTCPFTRTQHAEVAQVCKHRISVRLHEGARLDTVLREVVAVELSCGG